ncbi:hypothetical protein [Streptomyces sp. NPDC052225]|uniref:hypothetical protein n=1 Tax=Streptomyces sp. NPDC052225 TaxID=3154949 RepID=UPI0034233EF9
MSDPRTTRATRLLTDLDDLAHPQRTRRIARYAEELTDCGELAAVIDELDGGGPYERGVAVLLACAGGDSARVAGRLADPDSFVRGHALRAAKGLGIPDSAFEDALRDAPAAVRGRILRVIVTDGRAALADRLVDGVRAAWGDTEAARLLPGCSPRTVARLLPELFAAVPGWTGLAKRHPDAVLDVAERELAALPAAARDGWWFHHGRALAAVAPAAPPRVLDLLDAHPPLRFPLSLTDALAVLAKADPARVLGYLAGPWRQSLSGRLTPAVLRALARSRTPELAAYARLAAEQPRELAALLAAQAPADRPATYETAVAGRGAAHHGVDPLVLDELPRRYVTDVARRAADAARTRGAAWSTVLYSASYLPPAEIREGLLDATRRPDAEDRAFAWQQYVRNAARTREPAQLGEVAGELARRLRNEQDPVRSRALRALADDVRPDLWPLDCLPDLSRIARDAIEARDSSYDSRAALTRLALGILRAHAAGQNPEPVAWALDTLVALHGHTGAVDLGRLDRTLRRGQEHQVYAALRPRIEAEARDHDYRLLLNLARALGRRAAGLPELQARLRTAAEHPASSTAREAIRLWLEPRATRAERVEEVLHVEPSAVELPYVADVLAHHRTDLLDPFLTGRPPYGRFLTGKGPWAFPVGGPAVRRWLPRQQQAYLRQLERIADDTGLDTWRRAAAIRSAASVPEGGLDLVRRWVQGPDVALAEAALGALGRTGEDLPLLLGHAGGDRARVAVYAATQATRHVSPSQLGPLLTELLTGPGKKVTSRKEAARLAATRLPAPVAAPLLARAFAAPDAHRDVRAACVAFAAYGLLGEDAAWEILAAAATDSEPVLRRAALRLSPLDLAPERRVRYAGLVAAVADTDDDELAALALAELASWSPWTPEAPELLARALTDVGRPAAARWHAAAVGLVSAATRTDTGTDTLCAALTTLIGHGAAPDAGEKWDRPAYRRVEYVAGLLSAHAPWERTHRPVARAVGRLLARHDPFVARACEILVGAVDLTEPGLRELAALHADRPALAARGADRLRERLRREGGSGAERDALAGALAASGAYAEGMFAWAVTVASGERASWPERWRTRLRELRGHPCPDVRDAASQVSTAPR